MALNTLNRDGRQVHGTAVEHPEKVLSVNQQSASAPQDDNKVSQPVKAVDGKVKEKKEQVSPAKHLARIDRQLQGHSAGTSSWRRGNTEA